MHTTRELGLFLAALSILYLAQATFIDPTLIGRNMRQILHRQNQIRADVSGSGTAAASITLVVTTPANSNTTPKTSSSTPEPSKTPQPAATSQSSTDAAAPSSTSSSAPVAPSSAAPTQSPAPTQSSSSDQGTPPASPSAPPTVQVITTFVTATMSDGSLHVQTFTTAAVVTPSASLSNNTNSNQNAGMSTQTRNTVIGVVVGIGGAIVVVGLGLVGWRVWGRKKTHEESDSLMNYNTGFNAPEKLDTGSSPGVNARTPFQSTLESYHAPNQVNKASNF